MTIDQNTKLSELMKEYPWLLDEAVKLDSRFAALNNPFGKALIQNATVGDLSKQSGLSVDAIAEWIQKTVESRS